MLFIWGTTKLDMEPVKIPASTLVEIQLLTTVDSAVNKVGDQVKYKVASDVIIDGRIVIPKGAQGIGRVTEVVSAGNLGKNGRVVIDFDQSNPLMGAILDWQFLKKHWSRILA